MSLAEIQQVPAPGEDAEIVGQVRYLAGGHVATDIIKLIRISDEGDLSGVIVAEDADSGESSLAVGFGNVHEGEATLAIDPRAWVAEHNAAYLHDVVNIGQRALGLESVQVDPVATRLPEQALQMAGLRLVQQPAPQPIAA